MKNLKKLKRGNLKDVFGGARPGQGCLPCDIYCSMAPSERPPCNLHIVAHCNECRGWGPES